MIQQIHSCIIIQSRNYYLKEIMNKDMVYICCVVLVAQLCLTLGAAALELLCEFQAKILKQDGWLATPGRSLTQDQTWISCVQADSSTF